MSITSKKITAYSKTHQMLIDVPSPSMSAAELKLWYDTAAEEARVAINGIIDSLGATTTGDSGAEAVGVEPIVGIGATNVQDALEQLRVLINDAVAGAIPDGTITPAKLSFDPATQPELDAHASDFTTHVEYALATGTANTYAVTLTPAPTAYTRGMAVSVEINVLNSGASTININGLGAKAIKKSNGNDVLAGNLKVGIIYTLRYNGTNFILQGEGGSGNAIAAHLLAGETATTDVGDIVGTMPNQSGAHRAAVNIDGTSTPGRIYFAPPAGYVDGQYSIFGDDTDFIASNVRGNIFGLQGTAKRYLTGNIAQIAANASQVINSLSFQPTIVRLRATTVDGNAGHTRDFVTNGIADTMNSSPSGISSMAANSPTATGFTIQSLSGKQLNSLTWEAWEG